MSRFPRQTDDRAASSRDIREFESPHGPWSSPPPRLPRSRRQGRRGTPWYAWTLGGCLAIMVILVLLCAMLAGAVGGLIFHFAHRQDASDTMTRTLAVAGVPTLTVDVDAGSVHVVPGDRAQVRVTVTRRAANATVDDARQDLGRIGVDVRQAGDDVAVTARVPQTGDPGISLAADVALAVPPQSTIAIRLASGDVRLDGVSGAVTAAVTAGRLQLTNVALSGRSSLDVRTGDVALSGSLAPQASAEVHIETGNATVELAHGDLVRVSAWTQRGDVTVAGWSATPQRAGDGASVVGLAGAPSAHATAPLAALLVSVGTGDVSIRVG